MLALCLRLPGQQRIYYHELERPGVGAAALPARQLFAGRTHRLACSPACWPRPMRRSFALGSSVKQVGWKGSRQP